MIILYVYKWFKYNQNINTRKIYKTRLYINSINIYIIFIDTTIINIILFLMTHFFL